MILILLFVFGALAQVPIVVELPHFDGGDSRTTASAHLSQIPLTQSFTQKLYTRKTKKKTNSLSSQTLPLFCFLFFIIHLNSKPF